MPAVNTPDIANRLREWREKRQLTRRELGQRVDCHLQTLVRLENGRMKMTTEWLDRLAKALNIRPADLLPEIDGEEPIRLTAVPVVPSRYLRWTLEALQEGAASIMVSVAVEETTEGAKEGRLFGVVLRDNSLNRVAPSGATLVVEHGETELVDGAYYALEGEDGAVVFRRFLKTPDRFEADSTERFPILLQGREVTVLGRVRKAVTPL